MARKHTEDEVLRALRTKNDVRVSDGYILILTDTVWSSKEGKAIINPKKKFDLGNGSLGKISYLVNYCGYIGAFVPEF